MKILGSLLIFVFSFQAYSLDQFSVTSDEMNTFVQKCVKLPSGDEMKKEIARLLQERKRKPTPTWRERFWSLFGYALPTNANIKEVSLDGLKMSDLNPYDLEVISRLTMHRDAARPFWKDDYVVDQKEVNGVTRIQRSCLTITCKKRNIEIPVDLSSFNSKPPCSDALCASQKIFGDEKGVQILWAYLKYGSNLSPYSDVNADPGGFDGETLRAILASMEAVPEHLREAELQDSGFYRFEKGKTLAIYGGWNTTIANANGAVFGLIDEQNFNEKVYIFTHELGHRSSYLDKKDFDESDEWKRITGWQIDSDRKSYNNRTTGWVSEYAKTRPGEDYAETYALYRLNPSRLKQISPERYQFMKEKGNCSPPGDVTC